MLPDVQHLRPRTPESFEVLRLKHRLGYREAGSGAQSEPGAGPHREYVRPPALLQLPAELTGRHGRQFELGAVKSPPTNLCSNHHQVRRCIPPRRVNPLAIDLSFPCHCETHPCRSARAQEKAPSIASRDRKATAHRHKDSCDATTSVVLHEMRASAFALVSDLSAQGVSPQP